MILKILKFEITKKQRNLCFLVILFRIYASSLGPGHEQSLLHDLGQAESFWHSYQHRLKRRTLMNLQQTLIKRLPICNFVVLSLHNDLFSKGLFSQSKLKDCEFLLKWWLYHYYYKIVCFVNPLKPHKHLNSIYVRVKDK